MPGVCETVTTYDPKTKIWSGTKDVSCIRNATSLGESALKSLMRNPDQIAQICYHNNKRYTNREIATLTIRVAQHFRTLPVEQCDVIGLCASNSDFVAPLYFGAMLAGLTVSTLDPSFDIDGIRHIFSITKPKLMFCDGAVYKNVVAAIDQDVPIYTMKDHIKGVPEITEFLQETGTENDFKPEPLKHGLSQVSTILCSSGTTGLPKGVCVSHSNLLKSNMFYVEPEDVLLCFSSLYWASGIFCLTSGVLDGCTRVISDKGFSPEDFFTMIEKYKVNVVFTPPSQVAMSIASPKINDYDFSSMKTFLLGGSAVSYSMVEKMMRYMPHTKFIVGYGMSEISCGASVGALVPSNSVGQVAQNSEVKIINSDGELLGPNETGEICIRTVHPWAGYYGNPEATDAIYTKDRWVHSGDVGYVDNEGNLYIVDRIKDILKYNNFHFTPSEIENVINELPGVSEVCVCGVSDPVSTHLPTAAIVKAPGSNLTEEEVFDYVASKMAHFKQLRGGVYFIDEMPKTASGKNLRRVVVEMCEKLRKQRKSENGFPSITEQHKPIAV